jgi:serine phosphatase RsbU (regulator of sigma subunit)/ligand-binding sensor domain-containing protein
MFLRILSFRQSLVLFFLLENIAVSNQGTPFITNIKYADNQQNFVWCIEQTHEGTMLIAGKTGFFEYDSKNWKQVETPDVAFTVKSSDYDSKIYVGGINFFGYLAPNISGVLSFHSILPEGVSDQNFTKIIETDLTVYFYSTRAVYCLETKTNSINKIFESSGNLFLGIFTVDKHVYLNIANEGLFEIRNNLLNKVPADNLLNKSIVFSDSYSKGKSIIGTDDDELLLFDGSAFSSFTISDKDILKAGILSDGLSINSEELALSTLNFGVILVNKNTGRVIKSINNDCGLPNDYVTKMFVDDDKGLWIAHNCGISRVDNRLPISNYSSYHGLTNNVSTVCFWNNKLYAATSTGVFALDSITRYSSKEILERVPIKSSMESNISNEKQTNGRDKSPEIKAQNHDGEKKSKKGFFKRLFAKSDSKSSDMENSAQESEISTIQTKKSIENTGSKNQFEQLKYNKYTIKSKDFKYSQLQLINRKCRQLVPTSNKLLAVTDATIYGIDKLNKVQEIFSNVHIYSVQISCFQKETLYIAAEEGIYKGSFNSSQWELVISSFGNSTITDFIEIDRNTVLLACADEIIVYSSPDGKTSILNVPNPYSERVTFKAVNSHKYLFVGNTLYEINLQTDGKLLVSKIKDVTISNTFTNQQDNLWIKNEENSYVYFGDKKFDNKISSFLNSFDNITEIQIDNNGDIWIIDNNETIFKINAAEFQNFKADIGVIIANVKTKSGKNLVMDKAKVRYSDNALTFEVVSPFFVQPNSTQYQYIIEGLMNDWSGWSTNNTISVPFLPPGKYTFKVRARNLFGDISEIESYSFKIVPPFWRTIYFYLVCIALLAYAIYLWQRQKTQRHIREKELLQQKVKERTLELELKNKSITDSIVYAERIQKGILPADDLLNSYLKEYFVLYEPRNIVSGDFYWISHKEKITYVVAADCTGHVVPGAFLSMLRIAYLNEIIRKVSINTTAADILEMLRERITKLFSQDTFITNDGIDIALLKIDSDTKTIQYSGAYNPLYQVTSVNNCQIVSENIAAKNNRNCLVVYKADKFHVGKAVRNLRKYTNHIIPYAPEDTFYIFSDGFVDQFGGIDDSKFMYGPFKNILLEISDNPMNEQKQAMLNHFKNWKGENEQTDDILIWGLKPL